MTCLAELRAAAHAATDARLSDPTSYQLRGAEAQAWGALHDEAVRIITDGTDAERAALALDELGAVLDEHPYAAVALAMIAKASPTIAPALNAGASLPS